VGGSSSTGQGTGREDEGEQRGEESFDSEKLKPWM